MDFRDFPQSPSNMMMNLAGIRKGRLFSGSLLESQYSCEVYSPWARYAPRAPPPPQLDFMVLF